MQTKDRGKQMRIMTNRNTGNRSKQNIGKRSKQDKNQWMEEQMQKNDRLLRTREEEEEEERDRDRDTQRETTDVNNIETDKDID